VKLRIENIPEHLIDAGYSSRKIRIILGEAAEFYVDKLFHKNLARNIILTIKFDDNFKEDGECIVDIDARKPRCFIIRISADMPLDDILKTLAHEITHMKQFAKGEFQVFSQTVGTTVYDHVYIGGWKGKTQTAVGLDYFNLPWEMEANAYMIALHQQFIYTSKHFND